MRNCVSMLIAVALLCAASTTAWSATYEFYRTADIPELGIAGYNGQRDVRLNDNFPDGNGGNEDLFAGDSGNDADNRSLIRFDLSPLRGRTITGDATVRLRVRQVRGSPNAGDYFDLYQLHPANAGWAEGNRNVTQSANNGQPTWDHYAHPATPWRHADGTPRPTGPSPGGGLGAPGDGYQATPLGTLNQSGYSTGSYVTVTIPRAQMQAIVDGVNPGLLLRTRDEADTGRLAFYQDSASAANGPRLTVSAEASSIPYVAAVQADQPLVYYRFNETSGTTALNYGSSWDKDGTYQGSPTQTQPGPSSSGGSYVGLEPGNTGVGLDGVTDHVSIPAVGISGAQQRTYEGWFQTTDGGQSYVGISGSTGRRTGITASPDELSMAVNGHRFGVTFNGTNSSTSYSKYTPGAFDEGWHHFAITLPDGANQSDQFQFFVDGVNYTPYARTLAGSTRTINTNNTAGGIGVNADGNAYLTGAVDEVAFYGRDLGRAGVAGHYATAVSPDLQIHETRLGMSQFVSVAQGNRNDWPDGSSGTDRAQVIQTRERTAGQSTSNLRTVSFLEFDLSALAGHEVLNAILAFRQDSRNVNPQYLQLARVADDWTPGDAAFTQAVEDAFRFGGTNTGSTGADKEHYVDVTDMVADWVSGAEANHGFRLAFDNQHFNIATFYHDGPFAPELIVTTASVPEPATMALLALAACGLGGYLRRRPA